MKTLFDSVLKMFGLVNDGNTISSAEAYLAGAHDLPDLEYRMRELDRPARHYGHLYTYRS